MPHRQVRASNRRITRFLPWLRRNPPLSSLSLLLVFGTLLAPNFFSVAFAFLPHSVMMDQSIATSLNALHSATASRYPTRLGQANNDDNVDDVQETSSSSPLFTVGVLADIQYAPIPDGYSFSGNARYYRHALDVARHAADHFEKEKLPLVLNLGDIVDGKCQQLALHGGLPFPSEMGDAGSKCVDEVVQALSPFQSGTMLHTYGNHCLYAMDRAALQSKLGIPFVQEPCGDLVGYYSYLHKGVRFLVLDSYDVALMRRCEKSSKKHRQAVKILHENNHNYPAKENSPEGLEGVGKRFVAFNGAVGDVQLTWLKDTLEKSRTQQERVIVVSHQPIHPDSTNPVCLMWNYVQVLDILREFDDVVVASFSGHAHKGGYKQDENSGIHFRVFEAVLENPHPHKTYAFVDIHNDRLVVRGFGNCESAVYKLAPRQQTSTDKATTSFVG